MTIRNPLDLSRLAADAAAWSRGSARQSLGVEENELVLLCVGTICPRKGQMDLVRAIAALPAPLRNRVRCFLVGSKSEPHGAEVAAKIKSIGGDLPARINLVGETPDVARYYKAADLFICTSRIECYPRVTQEAMAFGLPIITTPVFGLAEQVPDGTCGLVYSPTDVNGLAAAIIKLAGDDALRQRMAAIAPKMLESLGNFQWTADQFAQVFREAYLTGL
jgi:glycosyltransferase involved in cell wall biosynthesis